ncbi:hypothetical protein HMPREF9141_1810 [Prevotella multiformis DSM 16608]|uniref:Uncharacterized protein n=1 Tax=Prevotella multiformis DSM 16608 TaxID=888743 RepID=F0F893_9BACT|nr:hypothetical protein HMPREF9141_1810 [Prevotella multiformis DSM 16608]
MGKRQLFSKGKSNFFIRRACSSGILSKFVDMDFYVSCKCE